LISESYDWVKVDYSCSCGNSINKVINRDIIENQKCPKCEKKLTILKQEDVTEKIIEEAEKMGTKIELISSSTPQGEQFYGLGGIGGMLRYKS